MYKALNELTKDFLPHVRWEKIIEATYETMFMTGIATLFVFFIGIVIGLILYLTEKGNVLENKYVNITLSILVNTLRSIPFIILIVLLIPFTKVIIGSFVGKEGALPALIIGAAPFYARLVQIALREVDKGVIEASKAMGATHLQIIYKVLIPEALPAIISGITVTAVALVGYTAMAAVVGAGGLGYLAIYDGFNRFRNDVTIIATLMSIAIVVIIQITGDLCVKIVDKR